MSSAESGIDGHWSSFAYVDAERNLAGLGNPETSQLGPELRARSGDHETLELTYERTAGVWRGWLSAPHVPPETVAELSFAE